MAQRFECDADNNLGIRAYDAIGPVGHGHGPLGSLSQGATRDPKCGGLLLDPPGIGQDQAGSIQERDKVEIAKWLHQRNALGRLDHMSLVRETFLHPRMHGEDHWATMSHL